MAQVVRDALGLGLLRSEALRAVVEPYAVSYGHPDPAAFVRVLVGETALA